MGLCGDDDADDDGDDVLNHFSFLHRSVFGRWCVCFCFIVSLLFLLALLGKFGYAVTTARTRL